MKIEEWMIQATTRYPKTVLSLFILISIMAASALPQLERNPTPYLLPASHQSRVNLEKLRQAYTGSNDSIIVMLETTGGVFNTRTLERIKKLTQAFEQIHLVSHADRRQLANFIHELPKEAAEMVRALSENPVDSDTWMLIEDIRDALSLYGIERPELLSVLQAIEKNLYPIVEVTSLANTDNIRGWDGRLDVSPIFKEIPTHPKALLQLKREVLSNELFQRILVAENGRSTNIIIELALGDDDTNAMYHVYQQVKSIIEERYPGNEIHYIAGLPVVTGALGKVMEQDTQKLFPIVIMIVVACLFATFRGIKGIMVPLAVVILSLIVTLGLKSILNIPLNIITTTLPVFILSIGVADGIHMFSEYKDHLSKGLAKKEAVAMTLRHLTLPVVMTSITTGVAFYAISLTQIVQLNHFGIFVSIGTLIAMLFSLFFIPALLMLLPEKKQTVKTFGSELDTAYERFLLSITHAFLHHTGKTMTMAGLILAISLYGASKVKVDNNNAAYFLEDSPIFLSSQKLNADAAGSSVVNLLVESSADASEPFKQYENLKTIEDFVRFVEAQPVVGKVMGLSLLIKRINYVLNDEKISSNIVPRPIPGETSEHLISQLLLLYENGGGDTLSDLTDEGYRSLNLPVILKTNSSLETLKLIRLIKAYTQEHFPEHMSLNISGSANVGVAATDEIVNGQMMSLFISLGVVLIMLMFTFRKFAYALVAMVPLLMTISINFGVMGYFSIPLNIGTAIISSIVIGIGVDYSIHYLSRLKNNLDQGKAFETALKRAVCHSGKAIVSNAITVGLGFIALLFSVLTPLITMGWMITLTMVVSAVSTLILIPVLINIFENHWGRQASVSDHHRIEYNPEFKKNLNPLNM